MRRRIPPGTGPGSGARSAGRMGGAETVDESVGFGDQQVRDRDERKEIKVKIPISQHIKLHSIRLMMEQTISESVQDALENYFALLKEQEGDETQEDVVAET